MSEQNGPCKFLKTFRQNKYCDIGCLLDIDDYCSNPTSDVCEVKYKGIPFSKLRDVHRYYSSARYRGHRANIRDWERKINLLKGYIRQEKKSVDEKLKTANKLLKKEGSFEALKLPSEEEEKELFGVG